MKHKKLNLRDLKVQSFVTSTYQELKLLKGGTRPEHEVTCTPSTV